jgi:SNF2 family DNA or RNA helicase
MTRGIISSHHGQMVQGLLDEKTLQLYTLCTVNTSSTTKRSELGAQTLCSLEITVFGPWELCASIGLWFQDYDVYLQDPRTCFMDVKYCNPHKLASDDLEACLTLSEVTSRKFGFGYMQDISARPDLLDLLAGQNDLDEAPTPSIIQARLQKHQRQALTFMQQRERGWALRVGDRDIWEISDTTQGRYFINRVSNAHQQDPPQQFSGGIIADPMGLGKTLTMIALAASDLDQNNDGQSKLSFEDGDKIVVHATLIVVPQPLLGTWEDQLTDHVKANGLNFCRHHGKTRLSKLSDLDSKDVVLTTYHTLSADWQASRSKGNHIVFSVRWRRIILDEAHIVRNLKARMARAICDLDAVSRWAVTGTPIQNSLNDLAALLKFIRAFPYDEPKHFDRDISRLWKSGEDEEAVKRLKRVARCLVLRRAKDTIDLPPRYDRLCAVEFSPAEKALYDTIRQQTIRKIDDALQHELELSTSGVYVNVLQQLESMRLVCNLGLHYQSRHEKKSSHENLNWSVVAQETFNTQREMEPVICSQCTSTLDLTGTYMDDVSQEPPLFSQCLKYACPNCALRLRSAKQKMVCGHTPRCPIAPVSIFDSTLEETPGHFGLSPKVSPTELPSKVNALIDDLQQQPSDVKR